LKEIDVEYEYLNETIQKHTSMNADLYFHRLRINYILKKLYQEPKFRDYKAADLASICGYHSPGEFEYYFRKICKISSEYFIKQLKKESLRQQRNIREAA
ncbi:hypothetical protein AB4Y90_17980, partial [Chryseobacterium sp. 2TAF14]|uniref:hypothetical protein n=1 Tax=Chryseobacterium sp. 2TAF14 TaxID=3233007 RepID=UPI003F8F13E7